MCFEYRLVSIPYFQDELRDYEVNDILDNIAYLDKADWERTRIQSYITAQVNSTKKLKATDIIKLPWDDEKNSEEHITEITNADIKRLKELSKKI